MKKIKGVLCLLLAFSLVVHFGSTGYAGQNTSLSDITSDSIQEKENQINEVQQERQLLQSGLTDVKKIVDDLEATKDDLNAYVVKLDKSLNELEQKIADLKELISKKEDEIEKTGKELDKAVQIEEEQYAAMKERIQFMYEKGDTFYLELLLSAKSFGEMLNKSTYVASLSAYDRKKLEEFQETRQTVEEYKAELEEDRKTLEEAKAVIEEEQAGLDTLIGEKNKQINIYEADINNKEEIMRAYEAEIAEQNAIIAELEAAVAEERKRIAQENGTLMKYDGGKFKFPAPSMTRISEEYGNRIHPILKTPQFHNGIDIAAPGGSPILAAYDGEVVASSYSGTMGNYIMIDHGDGLYTIYMHASALYVSKGAVVARGDKIAAVGSTGRSTGNHLHFSVRLNGSYVSPWQYLS